MLDEMVNDSKPEVDKYQPIIFEDQMKPITTKRFDTEFTTGSPIIKKDK